MAWFGETFGDGLTNLKGQISKITKEVLSEDPLAATSFEGRIKDLEEERQKLQSENEKLKTENAKLRQGGNEFSDYQIQNICELENQLAELRSDKEALTKALDEIDVEHQKELEIVVEDRDKLREQLARSNTSHDFSNSAETNDLKKSLQELRLQNDILFEEGKTKDEEIRQCLAKIDKFKQHVGVLRLNLEKKNKALEEKLDVSGSDELNSRCEQLQSNVERFKELVTQAEEELLATKNENIALQSQVAELENKITASSEAHNNSDSSLHAVANVNSELSSTKKENDVLKLTVAELKNEIAVNNQIHAVNSELQQQVEILNNLYADEKAQLEILKQSYDEVKRNLDVSNSAKLELQKLQQENTVLTQQTKKLEVELEEARNKLRKETESHDILNNELATMQAQYSELKDRENNSISDNSSHQKQLAEQKDKFLEKLKYKEDLIAAQEKDLSDMEHKLIQAETLLEDLMAQQEAANSIQDTLETLTAENNCLRERMAGLEEKSKQANEMEGDSVRLEAEAMEKITRLQERLKEVVNEKIELEEDYRQAGNTIKELQEAFKTSNIEKNDLIKKILPADNELNTLQNVVDKLAKENEQLSEKLLKATELTKDLENQLQGREQKLEKNHQEYSVTIESLTKEISQLKIKLEDPVEENEELSKLSAENADLKEKLRGQNDEIHKLVAENAELQERLEKVEENVDMSSKLVAENAELHEKLRGQNDEVSKLLAENAELREKLETLQGNGEVSNKLVAENAELQEKLRGQTDEVRILLAENAELQDKLEKLQGNDEASSKLVAENVELQEKLKKLQVKINETEERENLVSGTLSVEIGKLKEMVNKIRRDFLSPTGEDEGTELEEDHTGEEVLHQSQTDDAKRLQQDVYQMMETIKMIDQGLTSLCQEKNRLEKELSITQSVANKTQQDLATTLKAKRLLENNIQEWATAVANRDEINRNLAHANATFENDFRALQIEKERIVASNLELSETLKMMELDKGIIQEKLEETERVAEEWKQRSEELQVIYENDSKRLEELCSKKDKKISELMQRHGSMEVLEVVQNGDATKTSQSPSPILSGELQDQVSRLVEENSELKMMVQQLRENIFAMNSRGTDSNSEHPHHRRSHSQVEDPKGDLQIELSRYQALLTEHHSLIEKEANLRKEVERLRSHLVEVQQEGEDMAMTTEVQLTEYRTKLAEAQEQLRSSTNVYKSANVRSTQHVEALQTQIQLITIQRNDLQAKLSHAEDSAQKQSAALASLQMVLEQFQVDKERELKAAEDRKQHLLDLERRRQHELEQEIANLKQQLAEAKNGLKAAMRLTEQLDKKSQVIQELEENLQKVRGELAEKEKKLLNVNLATDGKIDKFLVKNLVIGYLSAQGEHKTQALKILTSVLELSSDELAKSGVTGQGGWLNQLMHPSGSQAAPSESLSQAFVRFLETESRPQPQLKLLAEPQTGSAVPKRPTMVIADLMLPTVTPTQVTDTSLNDMLRDS